MCPVAVYKLYMSKIHPEVPFMWQRPKHGKIRWDDKFWFDCVRVGREPLENFMALLSQEIPLSKRYTNHSIRSTVMGILGEKFEGRIIIGLSGHKSENTVKQYVKKISTAQKREACNELATNILPKTPKRAPTATISAPPTEQENRKKEESVIIQLDENVQPEIPPEVQYIIKELNAPMDPTLENFLKSFDPVAAENTTENSANQQMQPMPLQQVQNKPQNQQQSVNMSVNNVQNFNPNRIMPAMYFPQSNVTINHNFSK